VPTLASMLEKNLRIIWDTMPTGYLVSSLAAFFALGVYLESAQNESISTPSANGVIRQHPRLHHLAPQFTPNYLTRGAAGPGTNVRNGSYS